MTTLSSTTPLATIVTEHPDLARELETRNLDYCCGGARTLGEACREQGLDPGAVIAELRREALPAGRAGWATMGPTELVDHLEATHHAYLHRELPRLAALGDKVVAAHGERHGELAGVREVFARLQADLEPHLAKEEQVLFPMIRRLDTGPLAAGAQDQGVPVDRPISVMEAEHDHAGMLLEHLRDRTRGYEVPADGCASYVAWYAGLAQLEADTHLHVHKENNLLFPAALALGAPGTTTG